MRLAKLIPPLVVLLTWAASCARLPAATQGATRRLTPTRGPVPTGQVTVLPNEHRPNVLLILADDLDARLGTLQYMPNLQSLMVEQGLLITEFFVSDPTCCPSRATILRGQYTHSHRIYTSAPVDGFQEFYALDHASSTLATWLQEAGYRTVLLGKYLNGYPAPGDRSYVPEGWDEWYSPARGKPYTGFDYTLNENGALVPYGSTPEDYLADVLSHHAQEFLRAAPGGGAPFFMFLSPYQPHQPAEPAPRHAGLFQDLQAPRTGSFDEADVLDKPEHIRYDPRLSPELTQDLDDLFVRRVQSMQAVDEMVSALFDVLQETGQLDNTYIIFTSDNGFHLGQHRMPAGKSTAYEEDINVPFIIRGPAIPGGARIEGFLAGNVDLAPTVAQLAGIVPPSWVEGRSLLPLFAPGGPPSLGWRRGYLIEYYHGGESEASGSHLASLEDQRALLEPADLQGRYDLVPGLAYRGLRTLDYKYVEYDDGFIELYDLRDDPFELNNMIEIADPQLLEMLSAWLEDLSTCAGVACLAAESPQVQ